MRPCVDCSEHVELVPALVNAYCQAQQEASLLLSVKEVVHQIFEREQPGALWSLLNALFRALLSFYQPSHTLPAAVESECVEVALLFLQANTVDPLVSMLSYTATSATPFVFLSLVYRAMPLLLGHRLPPKMLADTTNAIAEGLRVVMKRWKSDKSLASFFSFFLPSPSSDSSQLCSVFDSICKALIALLPSFHTVTRQFSSLSNLLFLIFVFASLAAGASNSAQNMQHVLFVACQLHALLGSLSKNLCCDHNGAFLLYELHLLVSYKGPTEPFMTVEVFQCLQCLLGITVSRPRRLSCRSTGRRTTTCGTSARSRRSSTRTSPRSPSFSA